MKLYTSFGPNPAVVSAFLAERNVDIDTVMLDITKAESRQKPYVDWNPAGTMPLLQLDDGRYIAESLAICEYLDEVSPGASLIGETSIARATTRMWVRRIDLAVVQPSSSGWRYAEGLEFCRHTMHVIPDAADDFKKIAAQGLTWVAKNVGGASYVCGDEVTLADILLYVFMEFGVNNNQPLPSGLTWLELWRERMKTHPLAKAISVKTPS